MRGTAARLLATVGALLLATGLVVLGAASASADKGGNGEPGAPGNNGTVKVGDSTDLDEGRPENDPHLPCTFNIQWFNFDSGWGTLDATVEIELQAPTNEAKGVGMTVASGDLSPSFVGNGGQPGAGDGMDHLEWYTLAFTGDPQEQQGYHVKITVTTPHSFGSDRKFKVFWVGPCETPESSAPPSSSPPSSAPPVVGPAVLGAPVVGPGARRAVGHRARDRDGEAQADQEAHQGASRRGGDRARHPGGRPDGGGGRQRRGPGSGWPGRRGPGGPAGRSGSRAGRSRRHAGAARVARHAPGLTGGSSRGGDPGRGSR